MVARTLRPLSAFTRNIALGSASSTTPSNSSLSPLGSFRSLRSLTPTSLYLVPIFSTGHDPASKPCCPSARLAHREHPGIRRKGSPCPPGGHAGDAETARRCGHFRGCFPVDPSDRGYNPTPRGGGVYPSPLVCPV